MTKIRSTKNALISAVLVLCMTLTALLGTTFAWFTDSVTSSGNKIVAGTLKVDLELMDEETGEWRSLKNENAPIFTSEKWEPGYTEVKMLKVENEGNLALSWKTVLTKYSEISALADVIDVYVRDYGVLEDASAVQYPADRSLAGYTLVGTAAEFLSTMEATTKGFLEAEQSAYLGIALKMRETAGNEYQGMSLGGSFDITVYATQGSFEEDSFDNSYDSGATFPLAPGEISKVGAPVTADANNQVSAPVSYNNDFVKTEIPTGALLEEGATSVETVVSYTERTADVQLTTGQASRTVDIHVNGLSENNTVPVLHTLNEFFPKNYSRSNVSIYHVDNGETVLMTHVESLAELDAHNEMYYDPATGDVVLSMATHSEIVAVTNVGNPWDGAAVDYSWYDADATKLHLEDVTDFIGFARIVGGMAEGIEKDDFSGKTVYLDADINLGGSNAVYYPVGYYNSTYSFDKVSGVSVTSDLNPFSGTFDGQGHTIANIYQNTWSMFGDYNSGYSGTPNHYKDGMGIFGWVHGGTVKNLAVNNFSSDGEFATTGCVAAYTSGTSTFDNIRISNSNPRAYNVPNGGVVGYAYDAKDGENTIVFKNITIDSTTKITALWGSWDVGCGGILGRMVEENVTVSMTDCNVAAVIDVYADVCGNYQYYQYRYAGMLIGTVGNDRDTSDQSGSITFENCHVRYGDWADYYYCELVENTLASYTHDHQMSRLEKISSLSEIQSGSTWTKTGNFIIFDENGTSTCYHIRKDANGTLYEHKHEDSDKETVGGVEVLKEDKQMIHIRFDQIYTGYGWGADPMHTSEADNTKIITYDYSITYVNDGKVLNVVYVTDNSIAQSTANDTAEAKVNTWIGEQKEQGDLADNVTFENVWMNAGSTKVESVAAGNEKDIVLYPSFANLYTATFVDQDGNILAWATFTETDQKNLSNTPTPPTIEDCEFDKWQVRVTKDGITTYTDLSEYKFNDGVDITVYPIYTYNGDTNLIGVDTDGDGITDEYHVGGYSNPDGQDLVEIPDYVNGLPITAIVAGAFSSYEGVHSVVIPNTVTTVGGNVLATDWVAFDSGETVTIYFEGSYDEWIAKEAEFDDGWDDGLGESSRIFFLDETGKVDTSEGYLQAKLNGYTQWDKNITWSKSTVTIAHYNEYYSTCNCDSCKGADRPDKAYWEGVVVSE